MEIILAIILLTCIVFALYKVFQKVDKTNHLTAELITTDIRNDKQLKKLLKKYKGNYDLTNKSLIQNLLKTVERYK